MHRRVMTAVEPFVEQIAAIVIELARADAYHALGTRDALQVLPNLRQSRDHSLRLPRFSTNVATSGRQRMRNGGIAPMPRLT